MSRSHSRKKNRHEGVRDGYLPSGDAGKKRMTTASPEQLRPPTYLDTGANAALAARLNASLVDGFAPNLKTKNLKDRKSVGTGQTVEVRVNLEGLRCTKKNIKNTYNKI